MVTATCPPNSDLSQKSTTSRSKAVTDSKPCITIYTVTIESDLKVVVYRELNTWAYCEYLYVNGSLLQVVHSSALLEGSRLKEGAHRARHTALNVSSHCAEFTDVEGAKIKAAHHGRGRSSGAEDKLHRPGRIWCCGFGRLTHYIRLKLWKKCFQKTDLSSTPYPGIWPSAWKTV